MLGRNWLEMVASHWSLQGGELLMDGERREGQEKLLEGVPLSADAEERAVD